MRKTILIILAVICGIALHAQDSTFNRIVTVERDYQPDIEQATKIKLRPAVLTKEVEPNPVIYSTYSTPLSVEYNLHPLQAAKVSFVPQPILAFTFHKLWLGIGVLVVIISPSKLRP